MAPVSILPVTPEQPDVEQPQQTLASPFANSGETVELAEEPKRSAPVLTSIDGGYAGLPHNIGGVPVALEQMGPATLNKTNVPMMLQGGVFVLLPLFFANNPAMFQQNRMFIWILFALGCGLIASQVPGVDNLNLPKIRLFGLEFAARGWVAVSIIVVMALVNPTKPILDVVSSAINNNKPVTTTPVNVTSDAKTGDLREVVPAPIASDGGANTLPTTKPLVIASSGSTDKSMENPAADAPNPQLLDSARSESGQNAETVGISSHSQDVATFQKISYKDRIILPTVQWQAMGIMLRSGDLLAINNVRGTWSLSDPAHDNTPMVDANGGAFARVSSKGTISATDNFIMPTAPPAALIGKIGSHGQPFIVGKQLSALSVNEGGELYLSINDGSTLGTPGFWDNAGQLQANVSVLTAANLD